MGLRFGLPVRAIAKVLILCALFWKVSGMLELRRDVAPPLPDALWTPSTSQGRPKLLFELLLY